MAMLGEVGRLDAAQDRLPAVQEEEGHGAIVFDGQAVLVRF